jgi:nitrite reductase/ring-hydroxylating ferredoxin subunit
MSLLTEFRSKLSKASPLRLLPGTQWAGQRPTYRDADPAVIGSALARSQRRPSGNWYPFVATGDIGDRPLGFTVAGRDLVAWRGEDGALHTGPAACPHLGADLSTGRLDGGALVCPWHGLRLTGGSRLGWSPLPAHDDGVLAWVRLDAVGGETPTAAPVISQRPGGARVHAVTRLVGVCEPRDVIANRLDPWHGSWFHPYSFARLDVLSAPPVDDDLPEELDRLLVAVTFKIGRLGIPVVAEFTSPEPRTILMRIVEGEGSGSVVETHATPLGAGTDGRPRTAVLEAVIAHSDRPRFAQALHARALLAPVMRHAATRLWRDDLVYAERLFTVRESGTPPA